MCSTMSFDMVEPQVDKETFSLAAEGFIFAVRQFISENIKMEEFPWELWISFYSS